MASPKLNTAARRVIEERIIAGDTNSEIRKKLHDAGHPSNLSDPAFTTYRQSERVKEALARKDEEAIQSGYAQRSERILKLAKSAKRFERRLAIDNETEQFASGKPFELVALHKEYRETIKEIGVLVDPAKKQDVNLNLDTEITRLLEELAGTGKTAPAG